MNREALRGIDVNTFGREQTQEDPRWGAVVTLEDEDEPFVMTRQLTVVFDDEDSEPPHE